MAERITNGRGGGIQTWFLAAVLWLAVSSDLVVTGDLASPPIVTDQDCASGKVFSGFMFTGFQHFLRVLQAPPGPP